jgi:hypothetical protein
LSSIGKRERASETRQKEKYYSIGSYRGRSTAIARRSQREKTPTEQEILPQKKENMPGEILSAGNIHKYISHLMRKLI